MKKTTIIPFSLLLILIIIYATGFGLLFSHGINGFLEYKLLLPTIVSTLLLAVFVIVTILTISLFLGIFLEIFITDESGKTARLIKKFFLQLLRFYQFLPEPLLVFFSFSLCIYSFKITKISILFIGLNLSLIILPILVKIVQRSLNLLTDNLKESLQMAESKIKFLINDVLPVISPYVLFHTMKIICHVSNFGLLFLVAGNFHHLEKIPSNFSNESSSFIKETIIYALSGENYNFIATIMIMMLVTNAFFHLVGYCIKRFVSIPMH